MAELTTDLIVQEQTYKARTNGLSETKIRVSWMNWRR